MWYPILAVANLVATVVMYVINALSSTGPDGTIFLNKTGDLSDKYYTQITPAGWTFSIWGFIYTWQALWVLYSIVNICRKGPSGPAYRDPAFLPLALFIMSIILAALNITWLISFDREEIELSCAVLIGYSFLMYAAMIVVYRALDKASPKLVEQKRVLEIWLTRALVLNGLAIQATWVTVATLLNITMVMTYKSDPSVDVVDAGTVALSILSVEIAIFAVTDLALLDKFSRYTITPYIVLVVALSGSLSKNYSEGARNTTFTIILLSVAGFLLLAKIVITIYKHLTRTRFTTNYDFTIGEKRAGGQLA